ncbi:Hint domain-containing protein [Ruegeria sp. ANG-S4]|uniref:Hint domain-containing protein n=1 Tax=Ruegeria sp. ANG-S4 TaxID=1577904 RepID=UPI0009E396A6|nr:Hint domain-containing protein [Ruegeria sp. ANG-S4]
MADYSIFVLGESQLTISVAQGLDGLNQGTGIHLIGETITIDSRTATEVFITDAGSDTSFADNDGNQLLDGDQTIDGTLFTDGTTVEAEYGITLTDGTNTWQAVAFNVNNSSPAYATVEGIAFIGGPGGFPPSGVPLTVVSTQEGPSFESSDYASPICFCRGTLVETAKGQVPIETLQAGDEIWTKDDGYLPVRWVGSQDVIASASFKPVELPQGRLGGTQKLSVSQQHKILVSHPAAELLFGAKEVFVPAISFVDAGLAKLSDVKSAQYYHVLLDQHSIIRANGIESESMFLQNQRPEGNPDALFFPDVHRFADRPMMVARLTLKRREAVTLLLEILRIDPDSTLIHTLPQTERGARSLRAGKTRH